MDGSQEALLVERALGGDERAATDLYEACSRTVYRVIHHMVRHTWCQPDELFQETMEIAFRDLDRFDPEQGSFLAWVVGIARQRALGCKRRKASTAWSPDEPQTDVPETAPNPEGHAVNRELRDQLQACISALGERQRDAFVLRELDGLSHRDVATVLGTSDMNVRKLVQRARASLRACLVEAGVRDA